VPDTEYTAILRRVRQIYVVLVVAGTIGFAAQGNRRNAASFLAGAAISGVSFWLLKRLVDDVGTALEGHKPRAASMLVHVFRLVLLGGAMFAILRVYKASPNSLCVGLLVPVVSITLEALYEWIYARA
jgi:hypothetical protein